MEPLWLQAVHRADNDILRVLKGSRIMSRKCDICGKTPSIGHNVSHANNKTRKYLEPQFAAGAPYGTGHGASRHRLHALHSLGPGGQTRLAFCSLTVMNEIIVHPQRFKSPQPPFAKGGEPPFLPLCEGGNCHCSPIAKGEPSLLHFGEGGRGVFTFPPTKDRSDRFPLPGTVQSAPCHFEQRARRRPIYLLRAGTHPGSWLRDR